MAKIACMVCGDRKNTFPTFSIFNKDYEYITCLDCCVRYLEPWYVLVNAVELAKLNGLRKEILEVNLEFHGRTIKDLYLEDYSSEP